MIRLALCDDDEEFVEILKKKIEISCQENKQRVVIQLFTDSDIMVSTIEKGHLFDVYILDIEMIDYSGLEIARIIEKVSDVPRIILITAYMSYAIEACGMNVFRYVLKAKIEQELPRVLTELFSSLDEIQNQKMYLISNQKRFQKLVQRDIVYIYKNQKNAVFVLRNGSEIKERLPLQDVYNKLANPDMVALDRGIIINLLHVDAVLEGKIVLDNGYVITTNKYRISDMKKKINLYWGNLI